jgi:hypothetical protein
MAGRLHSYGTTAQRLEAAVVALAQRLDLDCEPWSNPTGLILSFSDPTKAIGSSDITRVIRLAPGENDLHKLSIADQITELAESPSAAIALYDTVLGWWKTGKTVLNPGTHVRNVLGNIPFALFAGSNPLNPGNLRYYREALRAMRPAGRGSIMQLVLEAQA